MADDGSSDFEIDPAKRVNPFANAGKKSLQEKDDDVHKYIKKKAVLQHDTWGAPSTAASSQQASWLKQQAVIYLMPPERSLPQTLGRRSSRLRRRSHRRAYRL
jgi:hypothetical protein